MEHQEVLVLFLSAPRATCVEIYIYAYLCVYVCVYVRYICKTYIYVDMCVFICIYIYAYVYVCEQGGGGRQDFKV